MLNFKNVSCDVMVYKCYGKKKKTFDFLAANKLYSKDTHTGGAYVGSPRQTPCTVCCGFVHGN